MRFGFVVHQGWSLNVLLGNNFVFWGYWKQIVLLTWQVRIGWRKTTLLRQLLTQFILRKKGLKKFAVLPFTRHKHENKSILFISRSLVVVGTHLAFLALLLSLTRTPSQVKSMNPPVHVYTYFLFTPTFTNNKPSQPASARLPAHKHH